MNHVNFYLFDCEWYSEYEEKEINTKGLVAAANLSEATSKITTRLPNAYSLFIKEMDDDDFIFLDEDNYFTFKINGLGALDEEEEEE